MPPLTSTRPAPAPADLARRRQLVADAQQLARDASAGTTGPAAINEILIAWANTHPTGTAHDGRLWWELKRACAEFFERRSAALFAREGEDGHPATLRTVSETGRHR